MKEIPIHSQKFKTNIVGGNYLNNTVATAVNYIADAVATSYGPYGSHSILLVNGQPKPTKDGLKIIENMRMSANISQTILHMVHGIAQSQNSENGDGSTTMTLLFRALYNMFVSYMAEYNIPPSTLKNAVDEVVSNIILPKIDECALKELTSDDIYSIIYTSVDGDQGLADIIFKLFSELGANDPLIQLRYSDTKEHHYELIDGLTLDAHLINPEIVLNYSSQKNVVDPYIVIIDGQMKMDTDKFIEMANDLYDENIRNTRAGKAEVTLVVVCSGISEDLFAIISTISKSNPELFANIALLQYKHLTKRDYMKDLSVLLHAKILTEEVMNTDLTNYASQVNPGVQISRLEFVLSLGGVCEKGVIREYSTQFTGLDVEPGAVDARVAEIKESIAILQKDPGASNTTIDELEERMSMLKKNCALLYIGGSSIERKNINFELARDAVPQVLSAHKHGALDGMNQGILQVLKDIILDKNVTDTLTNLQRDIIGMIITGYRELSLTILQNREPNSSREDLLMILDAIQDKYDDVVNNIREGSTVPVLGSANTDKVVIKNASDMATLLSTSKLMLTTFEEHDLMELTKELQ